MQNVQVVIKRVLRITTVIDENIGQKKIPRYWRSVKILEIICMNAWYLSSYAMRTTNFAKLIFFLLLRQVGRYAYVIFFFCNFQVVMVGNGKMSGNVFPYFPP